MVIINKGVIIPFLAVITIIILILVGPIPQEDAYHHFADQRQIGRIVNFINVVTNIPFAGIGILGIIGSQKFQDYRLKRMLSFLFIGFLLLTVGSSYYHLYPSNETLVYDRIPMCIIFMSFFAFIIYDRIDQTTGYWSFILLNLFGIGSVIYWISSENRGEGDLRWYGMVQFFPIIAIPLILWLYKSPYAYIKELIYVFIFFGIAKFAEAYDQQIYTFLHRRVSGHSLKHIFMVIAAYCIVRMLDTYRKQVMTIKENIG